MDYYHDRQDQTTLAVWGLAFKAGTDDVRESPALYCIRKLLDCGMKIRAYDPEAAGPATAALDGAIETFQNGYDALEGADALVIFTDWQEFRNPDFENPSSSTGGTSTILIWLRRSGLNITASAERVFHVLRL
jgi:UDPglucose 6-dehydrogenase